MRNGLLSNLNDIFLIEGFGLKIADKFYQSLLQDPTKAAMELGKVKSVRTAPFITPPIEAKVQKRIQSCVSVRIGVNSITWARLELSPMASNQPCQLTHWQHHEISEKKLHINELIQRCLYVNHLIPSANCYLFENPQMAQVSNNPSSVDQQNINIQKAQVTAIMGFALASRPSELEEMLEGGEEQKNSNESEGKLSRSLVFYVRRFLTARLFNHLVGTERVSSESTVVNMMRTYYNINEKEDFLPLENEIYQQSEAEQPNTSSESHMSFRDNVQFPMELREMFSKAPPYHREFLSQALLLNLAFIRLVLFQDAESIAKVSRGNKNKPQSVEES